MDKGVVTLVLAQKPFDMGYMAVVFAAADAAGVTSLPRRVETGFAIIDKDNVKDPAIARFIYKVPASKQPARRLERRGARLTSAPPEPLAIFRIAWRRKCGRDRFAARLVARRRRSRPRRGLLPATASRCSLSRVWAWLFLGVMVLFFVVAVPLSTGGSVNFLTIRNSQNILVAIIPVLLLGLGQTFVIIAAGIDLQRRLGDEPRLRCCRRWRCATRSIPARRCRSRCWPGSRRRSPAPGRSASSTARSSPS